jgi:hypothetical protein
MGQEQARTERPSAAERRQESGAAALGRGGRMQATRHPRHLRHTCVYATPIRRLARIQAFESALAARWALDGKGKPGRVGQTRL